MEIVFHLSKLVVLMPPEKLDNEHEMSPVGRWREQINILGEDVEDTEQNPQFHFHKLQALTEKEIRLTWCLFFPQST